ncbi:MFS transporter [Rhodococcus sp. TAF43]|uniref:MFS transporter n=1 Tax=unclassified Rhodococcus (in: high G+C Gram-positive bacteria) TaxID=192944 RepID=UPI000E0B01D8|nr:MULTISPECIES: MFS transporter [unclassified Rhodococcus (in: high G+C Gram-positive bacteria)]QKT10803.1 MFS transporter [Rhodococcus sp. W8901]
MRPTNTDRGRLDADRDDDADGKRSRMTVPVIAFSALLGTMMQALVVPMLPELPEMLNASSGATSWMVTAMLLSGAISSVLFGSLGDLYGQRRMMVIAMACMVAGSAIGASATTVGPMIVARVLQGVTMAMIPLGISALRSFVHGDRVFKSVSLVSAMVGVGGALGFTVSAVAAEFVGLRGLFGACVVLGLIALAGIVAVVPETTGRPGTRVDVVGAVGLSIGVIGLLIALSNGNLWGWGSAATIGTLAGSVIVLALWGWYELRISAPLLDLRTTATRPILFTNLATIAVGIGMYVILLAQPQLMQLPTQTGFGLGKSLVFTGLCVAPSGLVSLTMPGIAARVSERFGPKITMVIGASGFAAGYVFLVPFHGQLWQLVAASMLIMGSVAFCFSAAPALILLHVDRAQSGQANGINTLGRSLGTSISSAVTTAILSTTLITTGFGAGELPSERGFTTAFVIAVIAGVSAVAFAAAIPREGPAADRL